MTNKPLDCLRDLENFLTTLQGYVLALQDTVEDLEDEIKGLKDKVSFLEAENLTKSCVITDMLRRENTMLKRVLVLGDPHVQ